jgi:hypothetical protein
MSENQATSKAQNEAACGICYDELNVKNCVTTPCNHSFCNTCFFTWLDKKETCALCRTTLLNDDVVRERAENLQVIQEDLVENYRYLKRIRKEIKKKEKEVKYHNAQAVSLQGRQIRLRMMLERLRQECEDVIPENLKKAQKTLKTMNKSLGLLNKYKRQCDEIYTSIPHLKRDSSSTEFSETKVESSPEEKSPDFSDVFPDVFNMQHDLDEMLEADQIVYRAQRRIFRQQQIEIAAREMVEEETSEETTLEHSEEPENSPRHESQSPFDVAMNAPVTFNFGNPFQPTIFSSSFFGNTPNLSFDTSDDDITSIEF